MKWELPKSPSEICWFLGLVGYYQTFIQNFSSTAAPLTDLTKKVVAYTWSGKKEKAFSELKKRLYEEPILILPEGTDDFSVFSDAFKIGWGCILTQTYKVVPYVSGQLKPHKKNYPTYDLQLTVVVFFNIRRHYLYGTKRKLYTDHKSLQYLFP